MRARPVELGSAVAPRRCSFSDLRLSRTASVSLRVLTVASSPTMAATPKTRPRSANDVSRRPETPTSLRQPQEGNTPVRAQRGAAGGATCSEEAEARPLPGEIRPRLRAAAGAGPDDLPAHGRVGARKRVQMSPSTTWSVVVRRSRKKRRTPSRWVRRAAASFSAPASVSVA